MKSLDNKVVVITGAGSGIGRALALNVAGRGRRLAAAGIGKGSMGREVIAEAAEAIARDETCPADVRKLASRHSEAKHEGDGERPHAAGSSDASAVPQVVRRIEGLADGAEDDENQDWVDEALEFLKRHLTTDEYVRLCDRLVRSRDVDDWVAIRVLQTMAHTERMPATHAALDRRLALVADGNLSESETLSAWLRLRELQAAFGRIDDAVTAVSTMARRSRSTDRQIQINETLASLGRGAMACANLRAAAPRAARTGRTLALARALVALHDWDFARQLLRQAAADRSNAARLRRQAIEELACAGDRSGAARFLRSFTSETGPDSCWSHIVSVYALTAPIEKAAYWCRQCLARADVDPWTKTETLEALGQYDSHAALLALQDWLPTASLEIIERCRAIRLLSTFGRPAMARTLFFELFNTVRTSTVDADDVLELAESMIEEGLVHSAQQLVHGLEQQSLTSDERDRLEDVKSLVPR